MEIYAFVGKTGTGKSYNAQKVAKQLNIHYIIDDAILIKDTKVIAGKSAKTEASKIASVKAAIFLKEDRKNEMKKAIKKENIDKILILGTSDEMIDRIVTNLDIGKVYKTIYIEDVATEDQLKKARNSRMNDGKHVVPVPTFEIKKQFSGYFLENLRNFNFFGSKEEQVDTAEKTIIRPTYSYLGNYTISDNVINNIIGYTVSRIHGVTKVYKVSTTKFNDGMKLDIDIEVKFGEKLQNLSSIIRNAVIYAVDNATGINLFGININVKSIKM